MASKRPPTIEEFRVTVVEEPGLIRVGLAGPASAAGAARIRGARDSVSGSSLPILVVDDGLAEMDTVTYGALVQWALAVRNRNIGWILATHLQTAGRMFQIAGLNPEEHVQALEESARKALDRGRAGQRVTAASPHAMALEGLRRK
ncbi:MAG TPA: hypothetical protein VGM51_16660 [Armatimonadota bacterium]|jgi:anti-anti-sigma regulatory factor